MARRVRLELTPAQLRAVNSGLALLEADLEVDPEPWKPQLAVVRRTRLVVHDAFDAAGLEAWTHG